ncbi:Queuosine salvage protein [Sesamum angolense]|uniref:Queuosine 5'-phosphate N-glycosylase/hydrolase n=1 Tax=Sesamum angolense TaxID=2727404 RepID=A0AAE1WHH3_9LAMI|nr:Queuosine salvage protein [Sesamum angolense]
MEAVRATSAWVASHSSHVTVDSSGVEKVAERMKDSIPKVEWDFEGIHYFDDGPLTVQYLFVLDALNFCFWPDKEMTYDHLAAGLKEVLQNDKSAFDADRLQKYTGPELRKLLKWPRPLPLEEERVRLMHEVGFELERSFDGKASKLVESCEKSAAKLVALITSHFPGFRDHTVYKGHQIFLYKRAQIFAADLWGAFKGQGYGEFNDIESVTMFADYIVPAVLQQLGVLKFSPSLANMIESNREISSGSEEEVELRACSVHAVEEIRELINRKSGKQVPMSYLLCPYYPLGKHIEASSFLPRDKKHRELKILVKHMKQEAEIDQESIRDSKFRTLLYIENESKMPEKLTIDISARLMSSALLLFCIHRYDYSSTIRTHSSLIPMQDQNVAFGLTGQKSTEMHSFSLLEIEKQSFFFT